MTTEELLMQPTAAGLAARIAYHRNAARAKGAKVRDGILEITLATGAMVSVPARQLRHLANLTDEQLDEVRVVAGGTGLMWRSADVDLSVDSLLRALTGLKIDPATTETRAPFPATAPTNGAKSGAPSQAETPAP